MENFSDIIAVLKQNKCKYTVLNNFVYVPKKEYHKIASATNDFLLKYTFVVRNKNVRIEKGTNPFVLSNEVCNLIGNISWKERQELLNYDKQFNFYNLFCISKEMQMKLKNRIYSLGSKSKQYLVVRDTAEREFVYFTPTVNIKTILKQGIKFHDSFTSDGVFAYFNDHLNCNAYTNEISCVIFENKSIPYYEIIGNLTDDIIKAIGKIIFKQSIPPQNIKKVISYKEWLEEKTVNNHEQIIADYFNYKDSEYYHDINKDNIAQLIHDNYIKPVKRRI